MYIDDNQDMAPVRRRIIQQPLRTEPPVALIVGDTRSTSELEERLKRAHPLIIFPSFSHFLAEPPRREPWRAIVVARSGAWDSQLDAYVPRRSCIALFGLTEEGYGWPETVARVRDLVELEPWLEALSAPQPPPTRKKERVKRAVHRERKATERSELSASILRQPTFRWEAPRVAPEAGADPLAQNVEAPAESGVTTPASSIQLELPGLTPPRGDRKPRHARPRKSVPARRPKPKVRAVAQPRRAPRASQARADDDADLAFTRLAAELGLRRAFEILDELRARALHLASGPGAEMPRATRSRK